MNNNLQNLSKSKQIPVDMERYDTSAITYSKIIEQLVTEVHRIAKIQYELLTLKKRLSYYETDLNTIFDEKAFQVNEEESILYNLSLISEKIQMLGKVNGEIIHNINESI